MALSADTLRTVQIAWETLSDQTRVLKEIEDFDKSWIFDRERDGSDRIAAMLRQMIERFRSRLCDLNRLLIKERHELELRRIYEPYCVRFQGGSQSTGELYHSYSRAVLFYAMRAFGRLPFDLADQATDAWFNGGFKPGDPLPRVDYDGMFRDGPTVPQPQRFATFFKHRDYLLETKFDTEELLILVAREYTTVADRLEAEDDSPVEYSDARQPKEWMRIFKSYGESRTWKQISNLVKKGDLKLRRHPDSTSRTVRFRIDDLKRYLPGYEDGKLGQETAINKRKRGEVEVK